MGVLAPYQRRVVDDELDELFRDLAAIAIEGPKGVGKTRTALERAHFVHSLTAPGVANSTATWTASSTATSPATPASSFATPPRYGVGWPPMQRLLDDRVV